MSDEVPSGRDAPSDERHTPGPWGWYSEDQSMAILCGYDENGRLDPFERHVAALTICKNCQQGHEHWAWGRCYTAKAADARLIKAAPDLLAALKQARAALHDALHSHMSAAEFAAEVDYIDAAIAKAERDEPQDSGPSTARGKANPHPGE